ncbi:hypothetical protein BZA05DRAFT_449638 [Tricharina praecox]|uniref:uncharacterized protein n=1 Tax=Tricharina praecox TaxID=43433 RepID=UPI00221FE73F|nr:uncharacterized protein BZA05DRAFT_449638 [Tricharina praecox]KAI5841217.1 hypothetical protein BZA05DRAFT_449638 [Tricharina praecox]
MLALAGGQLDFEPLTTPNREPVSRNISDDTLTAITKRMNVRYNIPDEAKSVTATIKPTIPSGGKEKAIENLCSVIQQAVHQSFNGSSASAISLGALLGERNVAWNCLRPRTVIAFPFEKIRAIPLDAVLKTGGLHPVEALKLGVQIALALMQLHTTQWLGNTWGKKDIFILHREVERE